MKFTNRNIRSWIKPLRRKRRPKKFLQFRQIVIDDIQGITERLNTRWLISIMDTFVDYSTAPGEREAAMMIVMFVNNEKLFRTYLLTHEKVRDMIPGNRVRLGDGVTSFVCGANADMFRNMMKRTKSALLPHPVLHLVFRAIILRMAANKESFYYKLDQACMSQPIKTITTVWE